MTWGHLITALLVILAFTLLAASMPNHQRQLFGRALSSKASRLVRSGGWITLLLAFAFCAWQWRADVGAVTWVAWLMVAGLLLAFYLPRREALPRREPRPGIKAPARESQSAGADKRSPVKALVAAILLLVPVAAFAVQMLDTPTRPLLRADALHDRIGPWSFTLAQRYQEPPRTDIIDVPMKKFVIRFCAECDSEIRNAYLKIRKPRSLRAAGNVFLGRRGPEKEVDIMIPPSAKLDDGLWLTVETKTGEIVKKKLDMERISPEMATYIKNM
ncbi:DUF3325 domain-containing protein [Marinobacterium mangrovicola]|uniref:Uncharacterized protein DUF3325 n=1 Tax=Marinobacterium mangrovicola TaxID=1476959 RepID=A0A4R1GAC9_9GAMM|nr:DUF3325 domain-containing protein [Marinobacterium mangrovicola]TCK03673.1 uncharacterized protein DUF3325 [Marinobacterium mangrovicola]